MHWTCRRRLKEQAVVGPVHELNSRVLQRRSKASWLFSLFGFILDFRAWLRFYKPPSVYFYTLHVSRALTNCYFWYKYCSFLLWTSRADARPVRDLSCCACAEICETPSLRVKSPFQRCFIDPADVTNPSGWFDLSQGPNNPWPSNVSTDVLVPLDSWTPLAALADAGYANNPPLWSAQHVEILVLKVG